jgi:hypothetical protein
LTSRPTDNLYLTSSLGKTPTRFIPSDDKTTFGGKNNIGSDDQEDAFHDGLAKVEVGGKTGFIDNSGKLVIPPEFRILTRHNQRLSRKPNSLSFGRYRIGLTLSDSVRDSAFSFKRMSA